MHVLTGVSMQAIVGGFAEFSRLFQLMVGKATSDALQQAYQKHAQDTCSSATSSNEDEPHDATHDGFTDVPSSDEDHNFFAAVLFDGQLNNIECSFNVTKIKTVHILADMTNDASDKLLLSQFHAALRAKMPQGRRWFSGVSSGLIVRQRKAFIAITRGTQTTCFQKLNVCVYWKASAVGAPSLSSMTSSSSSWYPALDK